jgi:hypothetical protein
MCTRKPTLPSYASSTNEKNMLYSCLALEFGTRGENVGLRGNLVRSGNDLGSFIH